MAEYQGQEGTALSGFKLQEQLINNKTKLTLVNEKQVHETKLAYMRQEANEQLKLDATRLTSRLEFLEREAAKKDQLTNEEIQAINLARKAKEDANSKLQAAERKAEEEAVKLSNQFAQEKFKSANVYEQRKMIVQQQNEAAQYKQAHENQLSLYQEQISNLKKQAKTASAEDAAVINEQIAQLQEKSKVERKNITAIKKFEREQDEELAKRDKIITAAKNQAAKEGLISASKLQEEYLSKQQEKQKELANVEILLKTRPDDKQLQAAKEKLKSEIGTIETNLSEIKIAVDEESAKNSAKQTAQAVEQAHARGASKYKDVVQKSLEQQAERAGEKEALKNVSKEDRKEYRQAGWNKLGDNIKDGLKQVAQAMLSMATKAIDDNLKSYYTPQAKVQSRQEGTDFDYKKALLDVSQNVGFSGIVNQKDVIANLEKLSDTGIAYNLELRAYLATVTEDIQQTFDAFDSNLLRLIRLQQADTTAARLGLESALNRFLNSNFNDTSYLSDVFDSVSQNIIEANSQLTRDMSIEFEYIVQKWLGALYSLGFSQDTINTISTGINYLSTGDVESLNSNESLQSLMAMSAVKAGLNYGELLTGGMTADSTNKLLKSMVEYLKEIAGNTDNNQVTKAAYSNVFGFNMSDLTAVQNLDVDSIAGSTFNYSQAQSETASQIASIYNRTAIPTIVENIVSNALGGASTVIGSNAVTYGLWSGLQTLKGFTGGIDIPQILAAGFGLDLHTSIEDLMLTGIAGFGVLGSLINALASDTSSSGDVYSEWDYEQYNKRGGGGGSGGNKQGTSESVDFGTMNTDTETMRLTALSDAAEAADKDEEVINEFVYGSGGGGSPVTLDDMMDLFEDPQTDVIGELTSMHDILDNKGVLVRNRGGGGSGGDNSNSSIENIINNNNTNSSTENPTNNVVTAQITTLDATITADNVKLITTLSSEIPSGGSISDIVESTPVETPPSQTMTPEMIQQLQTALTQAITVVLKGDSETASVLEETLKKVFEDSLKVTVTNDNFDSFVSKSVFVT